MKEGKEGVVDAYPTPEELWDLTFAEANAWRDRFAAVPFEDKGGYFQGRYYQDIAIERVMEAIAKGKSRILLTLATGTGKTFIAFQIAWKLFLQPLESCDWKTARTVAPAAHSFSCRPQHSRGPGVQRFFSASRGCAGAHRAGGHPQERARCRRTAACSSRFFRRS